MVAEVSRLQWFHVYGWPQQTKVPCLWLAPTDKGSMFMVGLNRQRFHVYGWPQQTKVPCLWLVPTDKGSMFMVGPNRQRFHVYGWPQQTKALCLWLAPTDKGSMFMVGLNRQKAGIYNVIYLVAGSRSKASMFMCLCVLMGLSDWPSIVQPRHNMSVI